MAWLNENADDLFAGDPIVIEGVIDVEVEADWTAAYSDANFYRPVMAETPGSERITPAKKGVKGAAEVLGHAVDRSFAAARVGDSAAGGVAAANEIGVLALAMGADLLGAVVASPAAAVLAARTTRLRRRRCSTREAAPPSPSTSRATSAIRGAARPRC